MKYLAQLYEVLELGEKLFKDKESLGYWLTAPNSYFFDKSPMDILLFTDDGDMVIEFLKRCLGDET